jgi:hypothetical protein
MPKLTKADANKYNKAVKDLTDSGGKIFDRMGEVLLILQKAFKIKKKVRNYWIPGAPEGSYGTLDKDWDKPDAVIYYEAIGMGDLTVEYDNMTGGWEWDYASELPSRFLFMDDAEILGEVLTEIQKEKDAIEADKKVFAEQAAAEKALAKKAKSKLSAAEKKALGIK